MFATKAQQATEPDADTEEARVSAACWDEIVAALAAYSLAENTSRIVSWRRCATPRTPAGDRQDNVAWQGGNQDLMTAVRIP